MGCSCLSPGKMKCSDEGEATIRQYEEGLGFSKHPVSVCINALNETTRKGWLSSDMLRSWLTSLSISTASLDIASDPVAELYANFLVKRRYSLQKLGTLAILLSDGPVKKKAQMLFQLYYKKNSRMDGAVIADLINVSCDLALTQLPKLAERQVIVMRDTAALHKLQGYTEKFSRFTELAVRNIRRKFLATEVAETRFTEVEFIEYISSKAPELVSAQAIRGYACDVIPELVRQQSKESGSALSRSSTRHASVKTLARLNSLATHTPKSASAQFS